MELTNHPHWRRRQAGPPKVEHHWNDRVGLAVTTVVGTMWMAYAFAALALVSLPAAWASHSALILVGWLAQTFIQLVLLPVIIVGQRVQARAADARAEMTYRDTELILHAIQRTQYTPQSGGGQ